MSLFTVRIAAEKAAFKILKNEATEMKVEGFSMYSETWISMWCTMIMTIATIMASTGDTEVNQYSLKRNRAREKMATSSRTKIEITALGKNLSS